MNPFDICEGDDPHDEHHKLIEVVNKNEIVVNSLINEGATVVDNLIAFNDKQINGFGKQIGKYLNKTTDMHDEFISQLISTASNALQEMIGETQIQTQMLEDIFHGVAGIPKVEPVDIRVSTGNVGPQITSTDTEQEQSPVVAQIPATPIVTSPAQIPPPYTSVIGGQSSVSVSVSPGQSTQGPSATAKDQGDAIVFAPVVTNTTTVLRQAVEAHKEHKKHKQPEEEIQSPAGFPVDPESDPIAWRFAPDDKKWRQKSADFLGPAYDLLLNISSMNDLYEILDNAMRPPGA